MASIKQLSDMRGRRVLITGGAGHLGSVIADTLAELGATIILLDQSSANLKKVEELLNKNWNTECLSLECNLEIEEDRNDVIQRIKSDGKGLSCLINNAAFVGTSGLEGWSTAFEAQSLNTWRRAIEVNLTAPFHFAKAFASELKAGIGGNIINITSIYGELGPDWRLYNGTSMGNPAAYAASKGGLGQLTRWLATTLAPEVRVNAVSLGGIFRNQTDVFVERYNNKTPLGRMATEDDFRGAIAYLASDMAKYVTGHTLAVDGGWRTW